MRWIARLARQAGNTIAKQVTCGREQPGRSMVAHTP